VHGGTRQHISSSGHVPGQTEVHKHRAALSLTLECGLQLLGGNPRLFLGRCAKGEEKLVFPRCFADGAAILHAYSFPIPVCHHLIDKGGCLRAKIEMIGMLVHVENEDRGYLLPGRARDLLPAG